jgi:phosphohistidine phosphatase SixA
MASGYSKSIYLSSFFIAAFIGLCSQIHAADKQIPDAELIASLKKGGHVIYLRHATTDVSFSDQNREELSDWSKQRNLSDKGRQQAVAIGLVFRGLSIPVSEVLTSPYCRGIETGKLAFGKAKVSQDLAFSVGEDKTEAERLAKALRIMLGTKPPAGSNTVLVAHSGNLQEAANLWPKPEGVAFVFKPQGNGAFEMVQRVEPQQWVQFAEKAGVSIDSNKVNSRLVDRGQICSKESQNSK